MGRTRHERAVRLSRRQTAVLCVYLILMPAVTVQCDESDAYPSYSFLSKIGSDDLSEQVVQRVAGELAKERLARQFGARRQTAILRTVAARMVSMRRFEATIGDLRKLVVKAEKPPLDIFPSNLTRLTRNKLAPC